MFALCLSLISGWRDRVQSGNPLYRPELYKQPPRGYSGPIWVRFFAKNTFRICAGATEFFLGPFHNFLAPYGPFFSRGGHFLKYVVRIWEMLGRTAVVMILPVFTEHKGFCPHIWDSDHIFQKGPRGYRGQCAVLNHLKLSVSDGKHRYDVIWTLLL